MPCRRGATPLRRSMPPRSGRSRRWLRRMAGALAGRVTVPKLREPWTTTSGSPNAVVFVVRLDHCRRARRSTRRGDSTPVLARTCTPFPGAPERAGRRCSVGPLAIRRRRHVLNAGTNDVYFDTGHGGTVHDALVARAEYAVTWCSPPSARLDEHHHTPTRARDQRLHQERARTHAERAASSTGTPRCAPARRSWCRTGSIRTPPAGAGSPPRTSPPCRGCDG